MSWTVVGGAKGAPHSKSSHRRESKKLIKSLNIYHQAERIQKWEVNDPRATRGRKCHRSFSNTFETVTVQEIGTRIGRPIIDPNACLSAEQERSAALPVVINERIDHL
jgi:hypothetical protein